MTVEEATKEREEWLSLGTHPAYLMLLRYWKQQYGKDAYIAKMKTAVKPSDVRVTSQTFEALEELVRYPDRRILELEKIIAAQSDARHSQSRRGGL